MEHKALSTNIVSNLNLKLILALLVAVPPLWYYRYKKNC